MLRIYIVKCNLDGLIDLFLEDFKRNEKKRFNRPYFNNTARHIIVEQIADEERDFILDAMLGRGIIQEIIKDSQNGVYEIVESSSY